MTYVAGGMIHSTNAIGPFIVIGAFIYARSAHFSMIDILDFQLYRILYFGDSFPWLLVRKELPALSTYPLCYQNFLFSSNFCHYHGTQIPALGLCAFDAHMLWLRLQKNDIQTFFETFLQFWLCSLGGNRKLRHRREKSVDIVGKLINLRRGPHDRHIIDDRSPLTLSVYPVTGHSLYIWISILDIVSI